MQLLIRLAAVGALCSVTAAWGQNCPTPERWPGAEWEDQSAAVKQAKAAAISALEAYAFTPTGAFEDRVGIRTDGVVIIQHGALVYERYANGFDASKRHLTWSVSKSFTAALTGIAIGKGVLGVDDSVCKHLTWATGAACDIKVRHLLEMASGLAWQEVYEGKSNQASSVLSMLYGSGYANTPQFVLSHGFQDPPGTSWMYSSGDSTLLMAVVQAALEPKDGKRFPWTLLFDPLGIKSAIWERGGSGTMIGSSYLYATPRDLARFGYFALNDGCWVGQRILPEGWLATSTQVNQPIQTKSYFREEDDSYGWQWWLNKAIPNVTTERPYPDVPEDAFMALGHWGQSITVIPSMDVVVVRVGDDRDGSFELEQFLELALAVVTP